MPDNIISCVTSGSRQQEITMREVLAGLEDIVTMLSYDPWPGDFEIIAIHSPEYDHSHTHETTVARNHPTPRTQADIISWEKHKAVRLSA